MRPLLLALLLPLALAGCDGASGPEAETPDPAALRAAPTTATVAGADLTLSAYLWRDFMPGPDAPEDGSGLLGALYVQPAEGAALPAGVRADAVFVVDGDETWAATPEVAADVDLYNRLALRVSDGPAWDVGRRVDVVVRLRDGGGETHLLRAADQPIHRTD